MSHIAIFPSKFRTGAFGRTYAVLAAICVQLHISAVAIVAMVTVEQWDSFILVCI